MTNRAPIDYLNDALSAGARNPEILFRAALVYNHFGDTSQHPYIL